MASFIITQIKEAELSITNSSLYDVILLPQSEGVNDNGRIISVYGGHMAGEDPELEGYGLSLSKSDACVSIGGNYRDNEELTFETFSGFWAGSSWALDFAGPQKDITIDANYNINHISYNDEPASGAIHYRGNDGKLVLTAQSGATKANEYEMSESGYKYKTDDGIALRAQNYGMYSRYGYTEDGKNNELVYGSSNLVPAAPGNSTEAYTIHADKNLTVISDLAGEITADVSCIHTGYTVKSGDSVDFADDSSNVTAAAAGVKAEKLILESNFRAVIEARNTAETFELGLMGSGPDDKKRVVGGRSAGTVTNEDGTTTQIPEIPSKDIYGSTIAGLKTATAQGNDVSTYGIWTTGTLDASGSIWGGTITARTESVSILAQAELLQAKKPDDKPPKHSANASNNTIAAYGLKSDGALKIGEMSKLTSDSYEFGNGKGDDVYAKINVYANANTISAKAVGDKDNPANASIANSKITAYGICAQNIEINKVTDDVSIQVQAKDNFLEVSASGGKDPKATDSGSGVFAYGIYAENSIEFGDFNGNVGVSTEGSKILTVNLAGAPASAVTTFGIFANKLSASNLSGTITVNSDFLTSVAFGIFANKISASGAITTNITVSNNLAFGIYSKNSIDAEAFSGTINAGIGINIDGALKGRTDKDSFDISGTITGSCGIVASNGIDIRISGAINADGKAIYSDVTYSPDYVLLVGDRKYDDRVELTDTAIVTGDIDLGAGRNSVILNSNASFEGSIFSDNGELNLTFALDGEAADHSVMTVSAEEDPTLSGTNTITVNMNYAVAGETYELIKYGFDAAAYWQNRNIAFFYQGATATVTVNADGFTTIKNDLGETIGEVKAEFIDRSFKVTVIDADKAAAEIKLAFDREKVAEGEVFVDRVYDSESKVLTLDWDAFDPVKYNLPVVAAYEIEYTVDGGNAIAVRLDGSTTQYDISGIANNAKVSWRMRLLGNDSAGLVSAWSDWDDDIDTSCTERPSSFDFTGFTSSVTDANPAEGVTGILGAVAQFKWSNVESEYAIRNYIIEYCPSNEVITLETAKEQGFSSIDDYIANFYFDHTDLPVYTKTVTGTQVDVAKVQNQNIVYWRIKAVDVKGVESEEWQAGETFRVWTYTDSMAPTFTDAGNTSIVNYYLENPEDLTEETKLDGFLAWQSALDSESGVASYKIELSDDNGKTWTEFKRIEATEVISQTVVGYSSDELDTDLEYEVSYVNSHGVDVDAGTAVIKRTIDQQGNEIKTLWFILEGDLGDAEVTVTPSVGSAFNIKPAQNENCNVQLYDYTVSIKGITGAGYDYRISAVDYFGNTSKYLEGSFSVDSKAPAFISQKTTVELERSGEADDISIKPTFTWSKAEDYVSDLGVRYYAVYLDSGNGMELLGTVAENGSDTYSFVADKFYDPQIYNYEIHAVDYFGRSAVISSSFGSKDMDAPSGSFSSLNKADIKVDYTPIYSENTTTDAEGNETVEMVVTGYTLNNATVVLSWNDNFKDAANASMPNQGVIYKVVISNDKYFSSEARTYEFWTTPEEGKQMVFDYKTPGRSATIFEDMGTIHWYVVAYDVNYNEVIEPSRAASFEFVDQYGEEIVVDAPPAAPVIIACNDSIRDDKDVCTDVVSVTWDSPDTLLGVYSFTVKLIDENGEIKYSKNSADLSDKLTTDLSTDIIVNADGTLTIADLKQFFGKTTIEDGKYKLIITSVDAVGRTQDSAPVDINVDTKIPLKVTVDELNSGAVPKNFGSKKGNEIIFSWNEVSDASGIGYYVVSYYRDNNINDIQSVVINAGEGTSYSFDSFAKGSTYYFKVVAYDNKMNQGVVWEQDEWYAIKSVEDHFADNIKDAVTQNNPAVFTNGRYVTGNESVGIGDKADVIMINAKAQAASISLTVDSITPFVGDNSEIKISIYTKQLNAKTGLVEDKFLKSYVVDADSRVFTDYYLEKGKDYFIVVENTDTENSVSKYNITIDKKDLATTEDGINAYDDKTDPVIITGPQSVLKDWVGIADTVDGQIIKVANSGRYTFSLDGIAASVKVTVYDVTDGWNRKKSVTSFSGTNKSINGVESKELLLDNDRKYYVEVSATDKKVIGTDYQLNINCIESFPAPTLEDNDFKGAGNNDYVEGWVGFKDGKDYVSKLTVGENGGVYSFTVSHDITSGDQAVKLILWQEVTGKDGKVSLKSVKNITLSNKESIKSLTADDLYLASGTYYVEVSAPGYTKGQNSYYTFVRSGYEIPADVTDVDADLGSISTVSAQSGWVGIGDKNDRYGFSVSEAEAGAYEFKISGINGKELTATVYNADTGKKVTGKTGVAGTGSMTLAGNFAAGNYYIEFTANGKTANSDYKLEIGKINANNADDKLYTSKQQAAGQSGTYNEFDSSYTGDWIGFTDATDFVKLDLDTLGSGLYDINITDIENPVKLTLRQAIRNNNGDITSYTAVKSVTLKAGTNSGVLSDLLLNKDAEYYVEITAPNAAKGDNTGYKLDISKAADVLSTPQIIDTAEGSKLYTFFAPADGNGGAYNFSVDADGLTTGTSVKLTVYELLTNGKTRSVKSVTVKADKIGSTGYLYFDQDAVANGTGIYMIEVKPANNKTAGNCTLSYEGYGFKNYIANAENDDNVTIKADDAATDKNWVGMGDASDTYKFTADAGEYSFVLAEINGNNIKISIVNATTGKTVKSFTPAANSASYKFTYSFAAGDYDIVISSADNGKKKYSEYTLDINRVETPAPEFVSNADDSWKLVAADTAAKEFKPNDTIINWVGTGDANDVFKINLDENGQIALDGYDTATEGALISKEITLALMDSNGKNIALTFDKASGVYESSIVLMADVDYYLNVKSTKPSAAGTAFQIAIK